MGRTRGSVAIPVLAWIATGLGIVSVVILVSELQTPSIEFRGSPQAQPHRTTAGSEVTAMYLVRRNRHCGEDVQLIRRWYLVDKNGRAAENPQFAEAGELRQAEVSSIFEPFLLSIPVPEALAPGNWVYLPELRCGSEVVVPEPLSVEVVSR